MDSVLISEVLEAHRSNQGARTLKSNIGDGYLYLHNPIFKNVRDCTLDLGYQFVDGDLHNYRSWPFLALNDIFKTKKIPVLNNYQVLIKLEESRRNYFVLKNIKHFGPQRNFLLHESTHVLAQNIFESLSSFKRQSEITQLSVLPYFLGEAAAHASEIFAGVYTESSLGQYFLEMNAYSVGGPEFLRACLPVIRKFGERRVLEFTIGVFLHRNYFIDEFSSEYFRYFLDLLDCGDEDFVTKMQNLAAFLKVDPAFREEVAQTYLNFVGLSGSISELKGKDPKNIFYRESAALRSISIFAKTAIAKESFFRP